jgi:hypothetical protein
MANPEKFLSTKELANLLGEERTVAWRVCRDNLGFSIKFGRSYKVPFSHYERVRNGERPEDIAAEVKAQREKLKAGENVNG